MEIGVEAEFAALFAVAALGSSLFDKFETETPATRKLLRWIIAAAATLGAYVMIGHWALAVLAAFALLGTIVHVIWCRVNVVAQRLLVAGRARSRGGATTNSVAGSGRIHERLL